jgi:hypothetical protein
VVITSAGGNTANVVAPDIMIGLARSVVHVSCWDG